MTEHALVSETGHDTAARPVPGQRGDVPVLGASLGPAGLLALQRSAGNQATAALAQRDVETPGGLFGSIRRGIGLDRGNEALLAIAADFIDNPVHRKCVYQYGRMHGAPLHLTREDMQAMNIQINLFAWNEIKAAMPLADAKLRDKYRDPEREQAGLPPVIPEGAEESVAVAAQGTAIANGSVAGCTAHVEGRVIASSRGIRFEGMVRITDRWDFDPAFLSKEDKSHRTLMGEAETIVGWAMLPGEPFLIDTDTVPVRQDPGTGKAELEL